MSAWRAWLGVHLWRPCAAMLMLIAAAAGLTRSSLITRVATQSLLAPVAVGLLVSAAAGVAVATGAVGPTVPLPDPLRSKVFRAVWLCTLTVAAVLACSPGGTASAAATMPAVIRNVLLSTSLAMLALLLGKPVLIWVAPLVYALAALEFGSTQSGDPVWWAVILNRDCPSGALVPAIAAFALVTAIYFARRPAGAVE